MAIKALRMVAKLENTIYPQFCEVSNGKAKEEGKYIVVKNMVNYKSAFGITSGVHFYETIVLTNELFRAGWGTQICEGKWECVDEEKCIMQKIEPIDDQHFIGFCRTFPIGTVLGCLLDFTKQTFAFFVNGRQVQLTKSITPSSNAYYVNIWIMKKFIEDSPSLLYFNFGQAPFRYPPVQCDSGNPYEANRYSLYPKNGSMPLFDNLVEPLFKNEKQGMVKETLVKLLKNGEMTKENILEEYRQLWDKVTFHRKSYDWRWWQAIIEMEHIDEAQVNVWSSLIEGIVEMTMEEWGFNWDVGRFLDPYSKLQVTANGDHWMYRNLAILFATSIQYTVKFDFGIPLLQVLSPFLFSAFLATDDLITAMFALIGLQTVYEEEEKKTGKIEIFKSDTFKKQLKKWNDNVQKMENSPYRSDFYIQLKLIFHNIEQSFTSSTYLLLATPTSLSPSDCSPFVKFSSDLLSMRSDFQWQSARSNFSIDVFQERHPLASPQFFFEVTLHTSGPMRIGWATKRLQLAREEVGSNEFSIGYDGHGRSVWHQGVQLRVENVPQWAAGDVIGCLLDFASKQFTFYQNGRKIEANGDIYSAVNREFEICDQTKVCTVYEKNHSIKSLSTFFSEHPYYAALSLGPYQQVTVNFGHTLFCHAPQFLDVWDFQQYSEYRSKKGVPSKSNVLTIHSANNSVINIEGQMTTGSVSLSQASVGAHQLPPELPYSVNEPTSCTICKSFTNHRLFQLADCPHFKFCKDCASKNGIITCKLCPS